MNLRLKSYLKVALGVAVFIASFTMLVGGIYVSNKMVSKPQTPVTETNTNTNTNTGEK